MPTNVLKRDFVVALGDRAATCPHGCVFNAQPSLSRTTLTSAGLRPLDQSKVGELEICTMRGSHRNVERAAGKQLDTLELPDSFLSAGTLVSVK